MSYFNALRFLDSITQEPFSVTKSTEGTLISFNVQDAEARQLLTDILKELKKMNLHLSEMTGEKITNMEIE